MKNSKHRSTCPISFSLDILGDKWVLLILRDMIFSGSTSYGEFLSSDEKVSTSILATKLELMEHNGLIEKQIDQAKRSKFIYSLTEKSIDLLPVLVELILWGKKYSPFSKNSSVSDELKNNKAEKIEDYRSRWKASKLLNQKVEL